MKKTAKTEKNSKSSRQNFFTKTLDSVLHNWPAKVISLTLAIIFVVYYVTETRKPRYVTSKLVVIGALREKENLAFDSKKAPPDSIRVTILGDPDIIDPIPGEDFITSIDLTGYHTTGAFTIPVKLEKTGKARDTQGYDVSWDPVEVDIVIKRVEEEPLLVTKPALIFPSPQTTTDAAITTGSAITTDAAILTTEAAFTATGAAVFVTKTAISVTISAVEAKAPPPDAEALVFSGAF